MSELLIQSCSKRKREIDGQCAAIDLYDGYFFRILQKAKTDDEFRDEIDLLIISAKYGVVDPSQKIGSYNQQMTQQRAAELEHDIFDETKRRVTDEGYDKIWINLGSAYEKTVTGLESEVSASVKYLSGRLGTRGAQLKTIVRTDCTTQISG